MPRCPLWRSAPTDQWQEWLEQRKILAFMKSNFRWSSGFVLLQAAKHLSLPWRLGNSPGRWPSACSPPPGRCSPRQPPRWSAWWSSWPCDSPELPAEGDSGWVRLSWHELVIVVPCRHLSADDHRSWHKGRGRVLPDAWRRQSVNWLVSLSNTQSANKWKNTSVKTF